MEPQIAKATLRKKKKKKKNENWRRHSSLFQNILQGYSNLSFWNENPQKHSDLNVRSTSGREEEGEDGAGWGGRVTKEEAFKGVSSTENREDALITPLYKQTWR